jgi:hypothetical protein
MSLLARMFKRGGSRDADGTQVRCRLCYLQFPAGQLRAHIEEETETARNYTIKMIRSRHPDWVASDGACPKCWDYYKQL